MKLRRKAAMALIGAMLPLLAGQAGAAIVTREENVANPRGWSAISGMDPRSVREMARSLPVSDQATDDQPWCDQDRKIETALKQEFGESKIATNAEDTALWGSELMGTWTMVLERPDATSCVIASGIGFSSERSPDAYFINVGLAG
ncbi:hypothetical protein RGQ15_04860 [Paracoccus sp. MBLB3053]|uniref:SCP domain-containing protein n=1 Tax=Paracoccus aurantius TaxID=3073814 RepID=A0ABU2HQ71_9RHOB|nr:hypothetical protein [Paracoccus sp. MBLB3053]MDS9466907.1 hypothetical protein [Paracoccus sp. MBLB3053]